MKQLKSNASACRDILTVKQNASKALLRPSDSPSKPYQNKLSGEVGFIMNNSSNSSSNARLPQTISVQGGASD